MASLHRVETTLPQHSTPSNPLGSDATFKGNPTCKRTSGIASSLARTGGLCPSLEEDAALIAALVVQRRGAAQCFAHRHDAFLRAVVLSSSPVARTFVDDLTHEVYAHLWRGDFHVLRSWQQKGPLRAYLRSIVRRLVWERLSGFLPCEEVLNCDPMSVSSPLCEQAASPEEVLVAHEAFHLVQKAFASLNSKHRQIIELRYYRDLSYREIADALRITPSNAGVRLARALADLKPRLVKLMEPSPGSRRACHRRRGSASSEM